jgi:hypothetical protein
MENNVFGYTEEELKERLNMLAALETVMPKAEWFQYKAMAQIVVDGWELEDQVRAEELLE